MVQIKKTNNSYLGNKVGLRISYLPDGDLSVLDCYGGAGKIWAAIKRETGRQIRYLPIDKLDYGIGLYLPGENLVYLASLDLSRFNVIDLDAYGVPYHQLEVVFAKKFSGRVFVTMNQVLAGGMPHDMMIKIGFSKAIIREAPTICFRNGWEYFMDYLALMGVRQVVHRSKGRKHYLTFRLSGAEERAEDYDSQRVKMVASRA